MATSRVISELGITQGELSTLIVKMGGREDDVLGDIIGLNLDNQMWENIDNIAQVVAYQGFDPLHS